MRLAEALSLRRTLRTRIGQLNQRLLAVSRVQEGTSPAENPLELLDELSRSYTNYAETVKAINRTNSATKVGDKTLGDLIVERDCLIEEINAKREFLKEAATCTDRYRATEIRVTPSVNVAEFQKQLDEQSKLIRELDVKIQSINWTTEVM